MQAETFQKIEQAAAAAGVTPGAATQPAARYDGVSIVLHWVTAALVVTLWTLGQTIDFFPKGAPKIDARSVHITLGAALGIVLLARLLWRASRGRRLPLAQSGWLGATAKVVHYGLYVLLGVTVVLGIFNAWQRGDVLFNVYAIPQLVPGDRVLKRIIEELHGDFADIVLIIAGLHAAAALAHHYLLRDRVLRRMLP
ncbi:MAG TPA: cytochrome b/b6 domain-containing protein [Steroidobacteraceae bacterium]